MNDKIRNLSGVAVSIEQNVQEERLSFPEIEIIYVVEGEAAITVKEETFLLEKEGILLVNSSNPHGIKSQKNSILCRVFLSYIILAKLMKDEFFAFVCNTSAELGAPYEALRKVLKKIIYVSLDNSHATACLEYSLEFELLDLLIERFRISSDKLLGTEKEAAGERLQILTNYVNMHYQEQVSLSKLAEKLYLSPSSLSRYFKKASGHYFADYVNHVRLHYAANDLIYTDLPITRIAVDNGFSNPSVFSKVFLKSLHMTPSEYRKQMRGKKKNAVKEQNAIKQILKDRLPQWMEEQRSTRQRQAIIDTDHNAEFQRIWNMGINIGSAYNLLLANLQFHTALLAEQLQFTYVRIWNIFSKKMKIRRDYTDNAYNFNSVDTVLDFLVKHGIRPFLDLSARPECAIKSGQEMVFFEEECMEFRSKADWEHMMNSFISHIIKRYGTAEVSGWIFEYTKDSVHQNVRFDNEVYSYPDAFISLYRIIKSKLPSAVIGGPSVPIHDTEDVLERLLEKCRDLGCAPDFISMIFFPYHTVNEEGRLLRKRRVDLEDTRRQIDRIRRILKDYGFQNCRLYITEWNCSLSNRNYFNDSCFRGAYIMKIISDLIGVVDMACFWMGSDWISNYYDSGKIVNGGSGLLSKDGIKKPAFYAFLFLNRLGKYLISCGPNYIITSNRENSYYIVCYNFEWFNYKYYLTEEDALTVPDLNGMLEKKEPIYLKLSLKQVTPDKKYVIKKHTVSSEYGSILDEWEKFQCEEELERSDVKYLRDICIPHLSMEKRTSTSQGLLLETELKPNETAFLHIFED